jgi:anti-sigma B factor antagonist
VPERTASGSGIRLASTGACRIEDDSTQEANTVFSASGELDLHVAPELEDRIDAAIEQGAKLVVLDLSAVTFIDSMALGVLLGAANQLRTHGGRLRLVVPSGELRRIFEISLFDRVFTIDSTRDEACAHSIPSR